MRAGPGRYPQSEDRHHRGFIHPRASIGFAVSKPGTSILVLFLGSSIGNFEPAVAEDFLKAARESMQPGDVFF